MFDRSDAISWFNDKYPKIKKGTITAHLLLMSTNIPSRVHHLPHLSPENDLFFRIDKSHYRLYEPETDPAPIKKTGDTREDARKAEIEEEVDEDIIESKEFAYERDLKNFLSKNLAIIEQGLRLYEEEGITGIEFPVGGRFIDILALDRNNNYVVIELKVSKGYDRVIGQLLRYMAWIERNHAESDQRVRGVIVASSISEDLNLAASKISDVELFEYELSIVLRKVK
jgi:hypothetical protein